MIYLQVLKLDEYIKLPSTIGVKFNYVSNNVLVGFLYTLFPRFREFAQIYMDQINFRRYASLTKFNGLSKTYHAGS